jgi:uncharacterized protein (DUF58 family)
MLAPCLLSLGALFRPEIFLVVATLDVALVLVAVADLLSLPPARSLEAERSTLRIVSVQQRHPVTLTVSNRSSRSWHVAIRDDVPQEFTASPDELVRRLPPRSRVVLHYD